MPQGGIGTKLVFWLGLVAGLSYLVCLAWYGLTDVDDAMDANKALFVGWKGAGVWLLAIYAWFNAKSLDGALITAVMAFGAVGDVLVESDVMKGALAFAIGHLVAIVLYIRNKRHRAKVTASQMILAMTVAAVTPLAFAVLTRDLATVIYGALLGLMAGAAWISRFPRYWTGIGAMLFVFSDMLIIWTMPMEESPIAADLAIWALYFVGQVLIVLGVTRTLAQDEAKTAARSS